MNIFILLAMVFLHIIDDFFIQSAGFLARGKQHGWWKENAPDPLYRHDYIVCLIVHGFSWAFMIMLPIIIQSYPNISMDFAIILLINAVIHSIIDDLKANRHKLNLIQDQLLHLIQICITFCYFYIYIL